MALTRQETCGRDSAGSETRAEPGAGSETRAEPGVRDPRRASQFAYNEKLPTRGSGVLLCHGCCSVGKV